MIKFVAPIILAVLFGCSGKAEQESNTTSSTAGTATKEAEGVIIEPQTEADTLKGSLKAYTSGKIGDATVTIHYYSPAVRGRMIWGGLVAYNNVWVTGAHRATSIEFDKNLKIGDMTLEAGKYAFFTIPGEKEWITIINKDWNQHLTDNYDEKNDVARLTITPVIGSTHQERLRYSINPVTDTSGEIKMHWSKLELVIPFSVTN
ncbi:MAG: DUF2911 domain-containing protein [Cyclobacteriaceae bacterium]|nr:DUF2911 domain-containing protein [Cyclobacteriaceae bacterium]HNP95780.1 DUF2911 domain-containing protein [Cyclobacteriaceae bacterium]